MIKKTKNEGIDFAAATPELLADIRAIKQKSIKHIYATGEIVRTYNAVFQKKELPTSCSSCNRAWVRALIGWLASYEAYLLAQDVADGEPDQDEDGRVFVRISTLSGVIRVYDDLSAEFDNPDETPEDGIDGVYLIFENDTANRLVISDGFATFIAVTLTREDLVNPEDTSEQTDLLKRLIVLEDPEDKDSKEKATIAHKSASELDAERQAADKAAIEPTNAGSTKGETEDYVLEDGRVLLVGANGVGMVEGKRLKAATYNLKDGAGKVTVNVAGKVKYKEPEDSVI